MIPSLSRTPFTWQLYVPYSTAQQMEYAGLLIGLRGVNEATRTESVPKGARLYIEGDCRDSVAVELQKSAVGIRIEAEQSRSRLLESG